MDTSNLIAKRRWKQFGLKTLLAATVLAAVAIVHFKWKLEAADNQRAAVVALRGSGVSVFYDYEYDGNLRTVPNARLPYPNWLIRLFGEDFFSDVVVIACHSGNVDRALTNCTELPRIRQVYFDGAVVSDDGLTHLSSMRDLERLEIRSSIVTDRGLQSLHDATNLRHLLLANTSASNEAIRQLQDKLPNCRVFQ